MQYELTFITKDEKDTKIVDDLLKSQSVKIIRKDEMGRKNLAYPIKGETAGFYWTYYIDAKPEAISEISSELNSYKEVIRYLMLNFKLDLSKMKKNPVKQDLKKSKEMKQEKKVEPLDEEKPKTASEESNQTKKEDEKSNADKKTVKKEKKTAKKQVAKKEPKKTKASSKKTVEAEDEPKKSDDQERIKKLEEKLDELLKD